MRRIRNLLTVLAIAATLALAAQAPPLADTAQAQPPLFQVNPPIVVSATVSLKDAIELANSRPGQDSITFVQFVVTQRGPFPISPTARRSAAARAA